MLQPCVYSILNILSGKRYIGKTVNVSERWKSHRVDSNRDRPRSYIGRAIKKHGVGNFTISIIEVCETEEVAYDRESYWIALYASDQRGVGYNLESGGRGGKVASESTRKKQSEARMGKPRPAHVIAKLHSPEVRARVAAANRGKTRTAETKAKIAAAHQGRPKSPMAVEKSASGHRGKRLSQEHRAKLSAAHKGVPHAPEHHANLAAANRRRGLPLGVVVQVQELAKRGLKQVDIAEICGIGQSSVSRVLRSRLGGA